MCQAVSARGSRAEAASPCAQRPNVPLVSRRFNVKEQDADVGFCHEHRARRTPPTVRLHRNVSLHFSAAHDGLGPAVFILKTLAIRTGNEHYNDASRFWARIFGINFALGVVTGIPMEFQFGTNWSVFSRTAGSVIGQTLAMEGIFSFFLESSFLGLLLYGERRLGRMGHWMAALLVLARLLAVRISHRSDRRLDAASRGYSVGPQGQLYLASFWGLLLNRWALWQFAHTIIGAVQTACFVMAAIGAYYLLAGRDLEYGRTFLRVGVAAGVLAAIFQLYPTGDAQGVMVAHNQPVTLAAMEGLFHSASGRAPGDPRPARRAEQADR